MAEFDEPVWEFRRGPYGHFIANSLVLDLMTIGDMLHELGIEHEVTMDRHAPRELIGYVVFAGRTLDLDADGGGTVGVMGDAGDEHAVREFCEFVERHYPLSTYRPRPLPFVGDIQGELYSPAEPDRPPPRASPVSEYIRADNYEGIILSRGAFAPTRAIIERLESVLAVALARDPRINRPSSSYKRSYAGVMEASSRIVDVNLDCDPPSGWERDGLPSSRGGGDCVVRARYDVASNRVVDIWVNSLR